MANFAPVYINLGVFKLNSIDNAAVVNMGNSKHIDIVVAYKRNQGLGEQNGDISPILFPITSVLDSDLIDTPTIKNSII
ncbi:hypothetical protein [Neobacillus terrae]|uniref:hypothetical protein n=1 Tax=Neobacillus terrae TaxID=3034837 RepID=UPI00140A2E03|nr:hypothetical protein [Neobacillus terrae]NHM33901.1 hypothetical protein [Neobacillus terrae]